MILSKAKRRILTGAVAGMAAVGAVVGVAAPAQAAIPTSEIQALYSPGQGGYVYGVNNGILWGSEYSAQAIGKLWDTASDGHGPYLHVYALYNDGYGKQAYYKHNTTGANTQYDAFGDIPYRSDHGRLTRVDVWVCNGGDSSGNGTVDGGCYGRRYYNQQVSPGAGSISLGTHASPTSLSGI